MKKRISIAMIAMILATTLMPTTAFAEDVIPDTTEQIISTSEDMNEEAVSERISADAEAGEADAVKEEGANEEESEEQIEANALIITEMVKEMTADDGVGTLIVEADEEVKGLPDTEEAKDDISILVESAADDIKTAGAELDGQGASLQAAADDIEAAGKAKAEMDGSIREQDDALTAYAEADIKATDAADAAIGYAGIANNSESKDEAYTAKNGAIETLAEAEDGLVAATDAYDKAAEEARAAEEAKNAAENLYKDAQEKLSKANEELGSAKSDVEAAKDKLYAAQQKLAERTKAIETYNDNLGELNEIRDQYYDLMVYYYRAYLGYGKNDVVYNDDGSVNIAESAQKMIDTDKAKQASDNIKAQFTPIGRYVTNLLVRYMLENTECIDKASITFGQDTVSNAVMQAGTLTKDANGNDKVLLNNDKGAADKQDITWHKTPGEAGRLNYAVVTYKRADDDKTYELRYNYIIKSGINDGEQDIADGMFYLAEIVKDEDGKDTYKRVEDINNLDSLAKLQGELEKATEAANVINQYENAQKAVDAAYGKVNALNDQIAKLKQNAVVSESVIEALNDALKAAQSDLKAANEKKAVLEEKVDEARKAVAAIDLSRFNVDDEADEPPVQDDKPVPTDKETKPQSQPEKESEKEQDKEQDKEQSPMPVEEREISDGPDAPERQDDGNTGDEKPKASEGKKSDKKTSTLPEKEDVKEETDSEPTEEIAYVTEEPSDESQSIQIDAEEIGVESEPVIATALDSVQEQGAVLGVTKASAENVGTEQRVEVTKPVTHKTVQLKRAVRSIEDENVALAGKPAAEKEASFSWLWILLMLAAITAITRLVSKRRRSAIN